jgi:carbamoyltransferase
MDILGISAFYHDSAAALVRDGDLVAAAQEERFTRKKHEAGFPANAVRYCLKQGGVGRGGPDAVVFYDKPILKFSRILQTYFCVAPRGLESFITAMPGWIKRKLWTPLEIEKCLKSAGYAMPRDLFFTSHHESHAASAFYPSPFESAAILTLDGVGEWATSAVGRGKGNRIDILEELRFPHSPGLLYSAFTYFCGFTVNDGEYKLMGLAPYGEPRYVQAIYDNLVDLKPDGSFRLNLDYFGYLDGLVMTNVRFSRLFGGPPRRPDWEITRREMDLARSVQAVTEEIVLRMAAHARELTGEDRLCLAGGVALNCVANGRLVREGGWKEVWIQPAAGDAGGAVGAALAGWHTVYGKPRKSDGVHDGMKGALLGPVYGDDEIGEFLAAGNIPARRLAAGEWAPEIAGLLAHGRVVGLFQGRMEFGPRALGNRSILADPRSPDMQSILNLKVKFRESFRPFAPACLAERAGEYFELDHPSPYMLLTAPVREGRRLKPGEAAEIREMVNQPRSDIPAVTHVDYSARIQTVGVDASPGFRAILEAFHRLTGCAVLVNTSLNVRGEPIVCTPGEAYAVFMNTRMDCLVLGSFLLEKPAVAGMTDNIPSAEQLD